MRAEKVANQIKRILAAPISEIAREFTKGLVTLTSVRVSSDLKYASLYISVYGGEKSPLNIVNKIDAKKSELRYILGKEIRLRAVPELRIFMDDTLDEIDRIQSLLDSIEASDNDDSE